MKNMTADKDHPGKYARDVASTRRMLRRDLSVQNEVKVPDLSSARNMAEQLEILERYIAVAPSVDAHLRNNIRNAIATGTYIIDPRSIAEKFLKFEEALYS